MLLMVSLALLEARANGAGAPTELDLTLGARLEARTDAARDEARTEGARDG